MASTDMARPPYDHELAAGLDLLSSLGLPPTITPGMIGSTREAIKGLTPSLDELCGEFDLTFRDQSIPGYHNAGIELSIFQRADHKAGGPGLFYIHGGGMIMGDRFTDIQAALPWVRDFDAVCVTVEYRLAPEHPDPVPVEDSYTGLLWTAANAADLGFDPRRLIILGGSAGGGLTAGVTLLARDREKPSLLGSMLWYPMLDDRNETVSSYQYVDEGAWSRGSNDTGWDALLGERRRTDQVSIYAAPARATDLSGLPPTFIDCGAAELFRDEDVAYANQIWNDGGVCELHVWPGAWHAPEVVVPDATISRAMVAARTGWLRRLLGT